MGVEAKALFMKTLEDRLKTILTAADMENTLKAVADQLSMYDLEQILEITPDSDDLLDVYTSALDIQGRSQKTIARYRYVIGRMMKAVNTSTRNITVYHLRNYLSNEKSRGIKEGTLEGLRQVFSAYFGWLQRENLIEKNPTLNLGAIKRPKKIKDIYSDIDIERLKIHTKCIRDKVILCFLASTACRINEVVQLNVCDINLNTLECRVLGKGNKERNVYFDSVTGMLLHEYLSQREDEDDALFVQNRTPHKRLTCGGIRAMLKDLGIAAHVEHVHPHKFRRTRATNLIRHGMPIQEVAAILGHDKLDTTMGYIVQDQSTIKNSIQKFA